MKANIFITDSDYSCKDKTFEYLLGFQPSLGTMILTNKKLDIILDSRYFSKTKNINKNNIRNIIGNQNLKINYIESRDNIDIINSSTNNINKLIIEGKIASEYVEEIRKKSKKEIIILEGGYFSKQREEKNEVEKENIKKAIEIIDETFIEIEKKAKSGEIIGKTELQIRSVIISKILELGGTGESFESIVAFGANSAIPHHTTGATVIGNGPLLIDMGALYNGYCSDFTRTIWIGEKNDNYEEFIKIYNIVKQAHINAFENTKSEMTGKDIDSFCRDYIEQKGYGKKFSHGTGHGVGLDIHESPTINKKSEEIIQDNTIFTIEPGIYLEGKFGIRLEDIVIMENGKLKKYTKVNL